MHDEPPAALIDLLARLRLAKPEQVRSVRPLARALARGLPLFESVWVDALVQTRLLTPFQGSEINAGRGEQLQVGPYLLQTTCGAPLGWANSFVTNHRETKRIVHLLVARRGKSAPSESCAVELQSMLERFCEKPPSPENSDAVSSPTPQKHFKIEKPANGIARLEAASADGQTLWAAFTPTTGVSAAQWLSWHGRLPPAAVLEIARQMSTVLALLETAGNAHGDIAASSLMLTEKGEVQLARCGVRNIFRPDESAAVDDLPIESFDYLAPERLTARSSATTSHDVYSCGCVWWHLLTGRSPLPGGTRAAKLAAVRAGKIHDVRRLAPDVPKLLADLIERCTQHDPAQRPSKFAELAQQLGPSTRAGRRKLADVLAKSGRRTAQINWSWRARAGLQRAATQLMATAACLVLLAAATWPLWRSRPSPADHVASRSAASPGTSPPKLAKVVASMGVDPAVRQANYQVSENPNNQSAAPIDKRESTTSSQPAKAIPRPVIELEADKEIPGASLRLQPGTIVRGIGQGRPRIVTPANGLAVTADNVRFENIDFLWRQRPEAIASPERQALIDLRTAHAEFIGCTFQAAAAGSQELPPAVRLAGSSQRATLAPAGQVRLERCALASVACGIDCALAAPTAVEVNNTLYLGSGPLVRFSQPRHSDVPGSITLEHVTLRGASSVLEINAGEVAEELAPLSITATGCVLAPEAGGLLIFSGRGAETSIAGKLRGIEWLGGSSLTPPDTAVAIWRHGDANDPLADDELSIDGLVASPVEFVGAATNDPANSHLKKWLAPLQSEEPPGIADNVPKIPSVESTIATAPAAQKK